MIFVSAGLGEDFNTAIAQLVEFGGERVLVDTNLANRRLGWELSGGEAINVELPAVGSGRRTSQGLQIGEQLIGSR